MAIISCTNCGTKNRVDEGTAAEMQPVCGKCGAALDVSAAAAAAKPITLTDATFASEVLGARGVLILVDYWAEWCGPCRMVAPEIEKLAAKYAGVVEVRKLDVDANPHTAMHYGIMSIPTVAMFAPGQPPRAAVGFRPAEALEEAFGLAAYADGAAAGAATETATEAGTPTES